MEQLARDAREHGLVVLAGAGISMVSPSALPGWTQLNTAFVEALGLAVATHVGEPMGAYVDLVLQRRDDAGCIPPELQAQLAEDEVDVDYFRLLQTLDIEVYNACHGALAALAAAGVLRALVTTNFDRLAEHALDAAEVPHRVYSRVEDFDGLDVALARDDLPLPVIKVHGSVEHTDSMVDTLRQRVIGRPDALNAALAALLGRHAVLVVGFSGADLAYDAHYLGLRAGAEACPAFTVLNRAGTEPLPAMADLVDACGGRFVEAELPDTLERIADTLAPDETQPSYGWDGELELPGSRVQRVAMLAYDWVESLGPTRAGNTLAALCDAAGSSHAALLLLQAMEEPHLAAGPEIDGPWLRYVYLMGHHLAEYGALEPDPEDSGRLVAGHYLHMAGTNGRLEGLAELARVYAYVGATEQALALTADALAALDAVRGPSVAIDVLLALVATERLVGRWPEAREHAQRALALCRESGDEPRHARACAYLGSMLALATRPDEARAAALEGVAIAKRLRLAVIEAHCHVALGRAELAAERPAEARAHLEPACACFKHSRHVVALTDALPSFFSACLRSGDIETATALMGELDALVPRFEGLATWYLATRATARLSADQLDAAAHEAGRLRAAGEALEHPWAIAEADRIDAAVRAAQTS